MTTNADQLRQEAARLRAEAIQLNTQSNEASDRGNFTLARQLLAEANTKLDQSETLARQANLSANSTGTSSAGQVVAAEQRARSDDATVQNPQSPFVQTSTGLNVLPEEQIEFGTNGRIRSVEETQSTPPLNTGAPLPFSVNDDDGNPLPGTPTTQAGAGASRDDNTAPNSNRTSQIINARFNQKITPQPNVLDEYASYTYSLTWYLMTPTQYNELISSQKKDCTNWQLLMQSGGASVKAAGPTGNSSPTAGRNKFFDKDYYLDNLEIESRIPFKGTGAADGRVSIKFTVMEPHGITLIENLYKAVSELYKQTNVTKTANYATAQYCMVIRFYGYNENGDLVSVGRRGTNGQTNLTDPKAIVEKFYPFMLADIKFKIPKDRVVEYSIEGKPIPHFYNKSQDRGTIPFSFELSGETLEQVLRGRPAAPSAPSSPGERRDSPQPNVSAPEPAPEIEDLGIGD